MRQIVKAWTFASGSTAGKTYQTLRYADGSLSCDCPGWTRRVQPDWSRTCKHVRDVEMGMADRHAQAVKDYAPSARPVVSAPVKLDALQPVTGRKFDFSDG